MNLASSGATDVPPAGEVAALLIDVPGSSFDAAVAFWAAALSADADALPGMPGGGDVYVTLRGATAVTDVLLQRLGDDEPPRLHLDVAVPDRAAAVARAESLGGSVRQREDRWDVLVDPAGLPLCVGFEDPDDPQVARRRSDRGHLEGVRLEVAPPALDTEVAFWSALLGAAPAPEGASQALRGARAVGGGAVGLVVSPGPPGPAGPAVVPHVRAELTSPDVGAEVERLRELGAVHVAAAGDGVTLADPAGNLLRVAPAVG